MIQINQLIIISLQICKVTLLQILNDRPLLGLNHKVLDPQPPALPSELSAISFNRFIPFIIVQTLPKSWFISTHSQLLYKIWNDTLYAKDWLALNFQQNFNVRSQYVKKFEANNLKVRKNLAPNRLKVITGLINFHWLNLSFDSNKVHCESKFLL